MDSKHTLSITEARKKIFDIAEDVQKPGVYYTLTENGRPKAVILSYEEYDSLVETLEVMEEFPDLHKDIEQVDRDVKSGAWKNYPSLEDILAKEGFVLAEKQQQKYGFPNKARKKSSKRTQ